MAWTYGGDPAANARDAIRFLCGDTDTNDQLLNDAEVAWVNNQLTGSDTATTALYNAAYRCCLLIASKFSRLADQSVGDLIYQVTLAAGEAANYRIPGGVSCNTGIYVALTGAGTHVGSVFYV